MIPGGPEWPSLIKDDVLLDAVRVLDQPAPGCASTWLRGRCRTQATGIDLSLALVEEHLGADVARAVRRVLDAVAEDPCGKVWEEQVPAAGHRRSNGTRLFTPISCATTQDVHMNPAARDRLDTVTS